MAALKQLLGVRLTTPNSLCLIERGLAEIQSVIVKRQINFLNKFITSSAGDEPLSHALMVHRNGDTKTHRHILDIINYNGDPVLQNIQQLKETCVSHRDQSTRRDTYMAINPDLMVHPVYTQSSVFIPDYCRISFTQMRLSSHRLRVETGRWQRVPREGRVCPCDGISIQDERHVLFECNKTKYIRDDNAAIFCNIITLKSFFENQNSRAICIAINQILKQY